MSNWVHNSMRGMTSLLTPLMFLIGLQSGHAQTEPAGHVVNVELPADSAEHRQQSVDFTLLILEMILNDVKGESKNPAFTKPIAECNDKSVSIDVLQAWLEDQMARIRMGENTAGASSRGEEDAEDYLMGIWEDNELGELPALMLMDYEDRTTYFYSESSGIEQESVWVAKSPPCDPSGCVEEVSKEQRPMYRGSRVLALHYLLNEMDESSRLIVRALINQTIGEVTFEDKHKISMAIETVNCVSTP